VTLVAEEQSQPVDEQEAEGAPAQTDDPDSLAVLLGQYQDGSLFWEA
jgi:hypothetical protein